MFVGGSIRLSKDFRLFLGDKVGPTKRETDFVKFMSKCNNAVETLYTQIYKNLGIDENIFNYAVNSSENIDIKTYLSESNYEIMCNAFNHLNEAMNLIRQSTFTEDISLSGKERITRCIFEAESFVKKLTNEPLITDRLLSDLAALENKSVFTIKKLANKKNKPSKKWYKRISFWIILFIIIGILGSFSEDKSNQNIEKNASSQENKISQQAANNKSK